MALELKIKEQLSQYLLKLEYPVAIDAYTNNDSASISMMELLNELAAMSDKIILNTHSNSSERTPSFKVNKPDSNTGIQFAGIPLGHEFTSLVLALLQVGGYPVKLSDEIIAWQSDHIHTDQNNYSLGF